MIMVVLLVWRRTHKANTAVPVAHADRLTSLPRYQKALAAQKKWLAVAVASLLLMAGALLVAAARPVQETNHIPQTSNRDIILCLDVSGSMMDTDEEIVDNFSELVTEFKGERIALTIFDATAVQVFPLTDDYDFVAEQLKIAKNAMNIDSGNFDFFDGTYEVPGSSLIGDGLASCVSGFPQEAGVQRSRSVVFATDNMLAGHPLLTLPEAASLAKTGHIRVYSLNPNDYSTDSYPDQIATELKVASESTGGAYYPLKSDSAVKSIVKKVQDTEAAKLKGAPLKTVVDQPAVPLGLAMLGLLGLGAATLKVRP
ncbi:VWA domain-containing protein [Arthrobacter cryoconiti]